MKIVVDENIPQAREAFESFGELIFLNGREITNKVLRDADVLLVRAVTKVDEELLRRTKVKFVATVTSGTDHVDINYLKKNKINFADASGCNSYSVAEFVISAIAHIFSKNNFPFQGKTIGVIGVGNIGSKVVRFADALGFDVLMNDPPLQRTLGSQNFVSLDDILQCNIITLHTPLNLYGRDKTFHLIDEEKLNRIKSGIMLINTSRGEVVDNLALKRRLQTKNDLITILDVWEREPAIDYKLLEKIDIGTAHIAGYSLEGKVKGTEMVYKKFCEFLSTKTPGNKLSRTVNEWEPKYSSIADSIISIKEENNFEKMLNEIIKQIYDIKTDDKLLREGIKLEKQNQSKHFDELRKNYCARREFNNYTVKLNFTDEETKRKLKALRFKVI
ncbi:MAG: 4-phosphoerythronate dehydrogenase [Bacteroidota bacterium]